MLLRGLRQSSRMLINFKIANRFSSNSVIYLDYQATTPLDFRVQDAMTPYMLQYYGNPHSKTHQYGWDTSKGV